MPTYSSHHEPTLLSTLTLLFLEDLSALRTSRNWNEYATEFLILMTS